MTTTWETRYPRRIPERRPEGHRPRAPRWTLTFAQPHSLLTSDYLAIQLLPGSSTEDFVALVRESHGSHVDGAPESWELLEAVDPQGYRNLVRVAYWKDATEHERWLLSSPLTKWFESLDASGIDFGAWHEVLQAPADRFETIYSAPGPNFGLAACPGTTIAEMTTNGYFGAARDRFPVSAIDALEAPEPRTQRQARSFGHRLRAESNHNMTAIRSGQYWQNADAEQLEDYEQSLQPKLKQGMEYLENHAQATGTLSLRNFTSLDKEHLAPLRETSTLGYFHSLEELEAWAEGHPTHHAIYHHALAKNRQYGADRTVVTWHEVFVLPRSSRFEYVNCHPNTGLLPSGREVFITVPRERS